MLAFYPIVHAFRDVTGSNHDARAQKELKMINRDSVSSSTCISQKPFGFIHTPLPINRAKELCLSSVLSCKAKGITLQEEV